VVLVEGIFLFKPLYRNYVDLTIWIDCSFSTALARAIARGQEGLSPATRLPLTKRSIFPRREFTWSGTSRERMPTSFSTMILTGQKK
jgi:uridine kinase